SRKSTIDDRSHARERDRGLCDVGRKDDLRLRPIRQHALLFFGALLAMEHHELVAGAEAFGAPDRTLDLRRSRKENQEIALDPLADEARDGGSYAVFEAALTRPLFVADLDWIRASVDLEDLSADELSELRSIEGRAHHEEEKLWPSLSQLPDQGEADIGMHASFMEFIEDDG